MHKRPKPNAIVYLWALKIIKCARRSDPPIITDEEATWCARTRPCPHRRRALHHCAMRRFQEALSKQRGVSAKQVLWQITPIPAPYFHLMSTLVKVYLGMEVWNEGILVYDRYWTKGGWYVIVNLIGLVLVLFVVSAMYSIAVDFSDPLGADCTDYNLGFDLTFALGIQDSMMEASFQLDPDDAQKRISNVWRRRHSSAKSNGGASEYGTHRDGANVNKDLVLNDVAQKEQLAARPAESVAIPMPLASGASGGNSGRVAPLATTETHAGTKDTAAFVPHGGVHVAPLSHK